MKNLSIGEQFKKTGLVVTLEIVGALLIGGLLVFGFISPQYKSWQKAINQNKESQTRLDKVSKNVEILSKLDVFEFKELEEVLALVLPAEDDSLRFVTLAENVAAVSGVRLSAAQVELGSKKTSVVTSSTTGSTSKPTASSGTGSSSSGPTPINQKAVPTKKELTVKISFEGSYPAILVFITNLGKADRVSLISKLSLSSKSDEGGISATIELGLPFYTKAAAASAENFAELNKEEKQFITGLIDKIKISAQAATEPLGKEDPFR